MGSSCSQEQGSTSKQTKSRLNNGKERQLDPSEFMQASCRDQSSNLANRGPSETVTSHFSRRSTNRSRLSTLDDSYSLSTGQQVLLDAYNGNLESVRGHLLAGFKVDFPLNQSGWTLAHIASQTGNLSMLEMLIEHHCDLDIQEVGEGWTPVMVAAINNSPEIAKVLLKNRADLSIKDYSQKTAIQLAEKYKSISVHQVLVGYLENR